MPVWLRMLAILLVFAPYPARAATLASWEMTANGPREDGLHLLSGGDGVVQYVERDGSRCAANATGSKFLYFQTRLDGTDRPAMPAGTYYATIEYFDSVVGGGLLLQYDSTVGEGLSAWYQPAESSVGGGSLGTGAWNTAVMEMRSAAFEQRQNHGADFRLTGIPLFIRKVVLTDTRPAAWAGLLTASANLAPAVRVGTGMELIMGGTDPSGRADAAQRLRVLEQQIPALKRLGATSYESYVRWDMCEVAPGKFDWSIYDAYLEACKRHGLKWVPYIIIGPAYSLPNWFYKGPEDQGYACLEHGKENDVQSLWNPAMKKRVSAFLKAFAAHYGGSSALESVLLGISGNYGEAIYPASPDDWTADVHGPYHTHLGYWAGDPAAVADFRKTLAARYGDIGRLNAAWGTKFSRFESIRPFVPSADDHNRRARLDLINWYTGSMDAWAGFWMTEARKNLPNAEIYLCTGGNGRPEHGSDFAEQCRIAASVKGGVRITNESSDYAHNYSITRWIASGGQQYGANYSFEPGNHVDANGVVTRIYNATTSGAKGLHDYINNLLQDPQAAANFLRYGDELQPREPVVEVAAYYPQTDIKLNGQDFVAPAAQLRDYLDFNYAGDNQIEDGGLNQYKALVMLRGTVAESATWERIADWVRNGGLLVVPKGIGRLETVEGKDAALTRLLTTPSAAGKGRVAVFSGSTGPDYYAFVTRTLADAKELSAAARAAIATDGRPDKVYITLCRPDTLVWLNTTDADVQRLGVRVPAHGIAEGRLPN